jgi:hypothetical protein
MVDLASHLQVATLANALVWPLAAGVAVVLWARARAAAHARRVAAMEAQLGDLYQTLETQPVPSNLAMVVEALDEGEALASGSNAGKLATPTAS